MGFWRKKMDDYEDVVRVLEEDGGLSVRELARRTGVAPSTIARTTLPGMEEAGILLSEDERGGLWPFGRRK